MRGAAAFVYRGRRTTHKCNNLNSTVEMLTTRDGLAVIYTMYSCSPIWTWALPLNKSQIASIDFVINRFFMKLFNTNHIEIVKCCQQEFCFSLPSITLARRTENFLGKIRQCDNLLVKRLLCM